MQAVDRINGRFGRGSIGLGLAARTAEWRMRQERLSPRYTTRWRDLAAANTGPVTPPAEAAKSSHSATMRGTVPGLKLRRAETYHCAASIRCANPLLSAMVTRSSSCFFR